MKLSFEELPQAVSEIHSKLSNIERLLQERSSDPKNDEDELLTIQQAAKLLQLSVPTLYGYVHRSEIPVCKRSKRLYFSKRELMEWIKSARKHTIEEAGRKAEEHVSKKRQ